MEPLRAREPIGTIETPVGPVDLLDGGVILWTVSHGAVIDARAAEAAVAAASGLTSGDPVAVVVDARQLGFADRKAREIFANSGIAGRVGTAVIVDWGAIRWLTMQLAGRLDGVRPIQVFRSEAEAMAWASDQVRTARNG